ncbi:Gmad2 immunoglobulin-like domain-containing protein [Neobacillus sp. LXY-1]|uniref:Gmad2 immunoglobulin-like domain-containing protein n=1 Tax=Neobacillus sp. LXY-1 TaxID=3379133 RepID=UPI003EE1CFA3
MKSILAIILLFIPILTEDSTVFRLVKVTGTTGNYQITGELNPASKEFFYTVEDGHNELVKEERVLLKGKEEKWRPFSLKIQIPREKLPGNGSLILHLYEKDKSGEIQNSFPMLLERF